MWILLFLDCFKSRVRWNEPCTVIHRFRLKMKNLIDNLKLGLISAFTRKCCLATARKSKIRVKVRQDKTASVFLQNIVFTSLPACRPIEEKVENLKRRVAARNPVWVKARVTFRISRCRQIACGRKLHVCLLGTVIVFLWRQQGVGYP